MRAMGVQWGLTGVEVDPETGKALTVDLVMLRFSFSARFFKEKDGK